MMYYLYFVQMHPAWSGPVALVTVAAAAHRARVLVCKRRCAAMRQYELLHALPTEIKVRLLAHALIAALESGERVWTFLSLSRDYSRILIPVAYNTISIHSANALRALRLTLAVYQPTHGNHLRHLALAKCGDAPPLGVEQLLLAAPMLEHLELDSDGVSKVCECAISRTKCASRPHTLTLALDGPSQLQAHYVWALFALQIFGALRRLNVCAPLELACTAMHCIAQLPCIRHVDVEVTGAPATATLLQHAAATLSSPRQNGTSVQVSLHGD